VIVPRNLDSAKYEDPITTEINVYRDNGKFKDCRIKKSRRREESSREKWVTDLTEIPSDIANSKSKSHQVGIAFDIPTTITALLMSLREYHDGTNEVKNSKVDTAKFQKEISTFTYRIAWQLKRAKLDEYVKVVEVENLENLVDKIVKVHRHFQDVEALGDAAKVIDVPMIVGDDIL